MLPIISLAISLTSVLGVTTCIGASTGRQIAENARRYKFALVPKNVESAFYLAVRDGCQAKASELGNVVCHYTGSNQVDATVQAEIIVGLIDQDVDGVAVAVLDETITGEAIRTVMAAGIPVITFDSDAPNSGRLAFVGTNNTAFGLQLGKVLLQLDPEGGQYSMITGTGPNLALRVEGVREQLRNSAWTEAVGSPTNCKDDSDLALEQMREFGANAEITAAVPVGGWPMNGNVTAWKNYVDANRQMTNVVADTNQQQLDLMGQGYVDGLVGQLPYQMGELSIEYLFDTLEGNPRDKTVYGTHLMEVLRIPLVLPEVHVDQNYIGSLVILGYTSFAIICLASLFFAAWTYKHRATRVVRASQPVFLEMICIGTLIYGSAIITSGIDDENYSQKSCDIACMATAWLFSLGFTTIFCALFSKTWRINKIFHNPERFKRIKVTEKDVIMPYVTLMTANIIVLACWTAIAPLKFVRKAHTGTDGWNRVMSTYGMCDETNDAKGGSNPYRIVLIVINTTVLVIANIQAYLARSIHIEFSESRYIALVMASLLQILAVGVPLLFLLVDQPQEFYIVMTILIFIISMAVLLLLFVPKVFFLRKWKEQQKEKEARKNAAVTSNGITLMNESSHDNETSGAQFQVIESTTMVQNANRQHMAKPPSAPKESSGENGLQFVAANMDGSMQQTPEESSRTMQKLVDAFSAMPIDKKRELMGQLEAVFNLSGNVNGPTSGELPDIAEHEEFNDK